MVTCVAREERLGGGGCSCLLGVVGCLLKLNRVKRGSCIFRCGGRGWRKGLDYSFSSVLAIALIGVCISSSTLRRIVQCSERCSVKLDGSEVKIILSLIGDECGVQVCFFCGLEAVVGFANPKPCMAMLRRITEHEEVYFTSPPSFEYLFSFPHT